MSKTVRLMIPDWQGGNKPTYALGAKLMAWLAPENNQQKTIEIPTAPLNKATLARENGVVAQSALQHYVQHTAEVLAQEQPDKVITFGGSCLISQAPFDYLHGKYGKELGVIWIDTHPDISTPKDFYHEHAMVLGNLLQQGDPAFAKMVKNPLSAQQILYVGLQKLLDYEYERMQQLGLNYQEQVKKILSLDDIQQWIAKNQFKYLAIHLDLDVLNPTEFRSLYFAEPNVTEFPAEAGKMTTKQLKTIMQGLQNYPIVGLSIAEYLPWDAEYLQQLLHSLDIFSA